MRNPILNQKMRMVDLGVAVCVDAIIHHAEALQAETLTDAEQAQHKAKIRENARTYKQAIDELLSVLDTESQPAAGVKNRENLTACYSSACGIADPDTDKAMEALVIATETAKVIPNITQRLIDTIADNRTLEKTLYNFSEMAEVYLQHVSTLREALQQVLILKEQGGAK